MRVLFRADASVDIGSGHVIRCLTLAGELRRRGIDCRFACRTPRGNLVGLIEEQGFAVYRLTDELDSKPSHALESTLNGAFDQFDDARQVLASIAGCEFDWLVVDHYGLDSRWERQFRPSISGILAIDDLANRRHDCDLLLDQNLGRTRADYIGLVPERCGLLLQPEFAILRPEFAKTRPISIEKRRPFKLRHLLIALGGIDKDNCAGKVLAGMAEGAIPSVSKVSVVLGYVAPWIEQVRAQAAKLACQVNVYERVDQMAELMASCDLAIGNAGGSAWERCCLGLPTIVVPMADNQHPGAIALERSGAARVVQLGAGFEESLALALNELSDRETLRRASMAAERIADGFGAVRVVDAMTSRGEGIKS